MAIREVQSFRCSIPAGTAQAAPAVFPLPMMPLDIQWIEWEIPAGARGNVGFWLGSQGQQIIPFSSSGPNWIVADGYVAHWDMDNLAADNSWELRGYNLGVLAHIVTVRFGLAMPPAAPASLASQLIPTASLNPPA